MVAGRFSLKVTRPTLVLVGEVEAEIDGVSALVLVELARRIARG